MLDYRAVETGEQDVVLIVEVRDRDNEESMILARVTVHDGAATVGTGPVRPQEFFRQRLLKVAHQGMFEF